MTSITRQQTQNDLRDRSIPVDALRSDQSIPGQMRDRMVGADLNGDGKIGGAREVNRLFQAVDHFDRNGSRNSLAGNAPAARALQGAVQHARPTRGLGEAPPRDVNRPGTPRDGIAPSTSGTAPATTTRPNASGQGLSTSFRQFREVDVNRLRAALPRQAQHLAQSFVDAGRRHNIDPLVLASISRHETANFTSNAFRNRNNAMGISSATGPRNMSSHAASIDQQARTLANPNGPYRNANTVRQMWGVYAPGPATGQRQVRNDPNNLNRHWGPGIAQNLTRFENAVR